MKGWLVCALLLLSVTGAHGHTDRSGGVYPPAYGAVTVQPAAKPIHRHHRRTNHHPQRRMHTVAARTKTAPVIPRNSGDLATVPTAAGISITVQRKLANQFQGFIADLIKLGYTPKHIGCWAPVGTHVVNSNHYHGGACDFDQRCWGCTAPAMYHISSLAAKWGLRDGCSFRRPDCGHIDDGTNIRWRHPNNLIARYIDYQTSPTPKQRPVLDNFEGGYQ
jgi:hypothetical protein